MHTILVFLDLSFLCVTFMLCFGIGLKCIEQSFKVLPYAFVGATMLVWFNCIKGTFLGYTIYQMVICHTRVVDTAVCYFIFCYFHITRSNHMIVWQLLEILHFDLHDLCKLHGCVSQCYKISAFHTVRPHNHVTSVLHFYLYFVKWFNLVSIQSRTCFRTFISSIETQIRLLTMFCIDYEMINYYF